MIDAPRLLWTARLVVGGFFLLAGARTEQEAMDRVVDGIGVVYFGLMELGLIESPTCVKPFVTPEEFFGHPVGEGVQRRILGEPTVAPRAAR